MRPRIPDSVMRALGAASEPLWYIGPLQVDEVDEDPLTFVRSAGDHPDDALGVIDD
jgi:hypothetical protein